MKANNKDNRTTSINDGFYSFTEKDESEVKYEICIYQLSFENVEAYYTNIFIRTLILVVYFNKRCQNDYHS